MAEDKMGNGYSLVGFITFVLAVAIVFFVGIVFWLIPKIAIPVAVLFLWYIYKKIDRSTAAREGFISKYIFPDKLNKKLIEKYPHLTKEQTVRVIAGLREYFYLCNNAGDMVAMPSQAVDEVWHEFILFTKQYEEFCNNAFGRFLHHTPAEAMSSPVSAQEGIERAWSLSCAREDISPVSADKLPILFALDVELDIPDGFKYSLDCSADNDLNFCAAHISRKRSDGGCAGGGCGGG